MTTTQILVKHYMESHLHQNLAYILILISIGSIIYITSVIKKSNTTDGIVAKLRLVVPHHVLLCVYPALFISHRIYTTECDVLGVKLQQHILPCN